MLNFSRLQIDQNAIKCHSSGGCGCTALCRMNRYTRTGSSVHLYLAFPLRLQAHRFSTHRVSILERLFGRSERWLRWRVRLLIREESPGILGSQNPQQYNLRPRRSNSEGTEVTDSIERPFRIMIAERDLMSADLLANALERGGSYRAKVTRPADLLSALATHPTDLVVIGGDREAGLGKSSALILAVSRAHPKILPVVILDQPTRGGVIEAFRSGARGVISREQSISVFLRCIEQVRQGYIWAGGREAEFLLDGIRSIPGSTVAVKDGANPLTDRELEVVKHAATGKTNKSIASELHLSEHTVKNYLFKAFDKLVFPVAWSCFST